MFDDDMSCLERIYYIDKEEVSKGEFFEKFNRYASYDEIVSVLSGKTFCFNNHIYNVRFSLFENKLFQKSYEVDVYYEFFKCYINDILVTLNDFVEEIESIFTEEQIDVILTGYEFTNNVEEEKRKYKIEFCDEYTWHTTYPPELCELEQMVNMLEKYGKEVKYERKYLEEEDISPCLVYDKTYNRAKAIMQWENAHSNKPIYYFVYGIYDIDFAKDEVLVKTIEKTKEGKEIEHVYSIPFYKFPNNDWHKDYIENSKKR